MDQEFKFDLNNVFMMMHDIRITKRFEELKQNPEAMEKYKRRVRDTLNKVKEKDLYAMGISLGVIPE